MRLYEDLQEEIIGSFKNLLSSYEQFKNICDDFTSKCSENKSLKYESEYLYDFCAEELYEKLNGMKEEILDEFYPINYADDEEDPVTAGELYRDSIEKREEVFGNF